MKVITPKVDTAPRTVTEKNNQANSDQANVSNEFFSEMMANLFIQAQPGSEIETENLEEMPVDQVNVDADIAIEPQNDNPQNKMLDALQLALANSQLPQIVEQDNENKLDVNANIETVADLGHIENKNKPRQMPTLPTNVKTNNLDKKLIDLDMEDFSLLEEIGQQEMNQDFVMQSVENQESKNKTITNEKSILTNTATFPNPSTQMPNVTASNVSLAKETPIDLTNHTNKYTEALTQLAHLINHHTSQTVNPSDSGSVNLQKTQMTYSETLQKLSSPMFEPKIEISSAVMNGITKEIHQADIKVHPPELGHVTAKLKVQNNVAELTILTENSRVKEIVQANLPQLRENFQNADINLTTINIEVQTNTSNQKEQNQQKQYVADLSEDKSIHEANQTAKQENYTTQAIDSIIDAYI